MCACVRVLYVCVRHTKFSCKTDKKPPDLFYLSAQNSTDTRGLYPYNPNPIATIERLIPSDHYVFIPPSQHDFHVVWLQLSCQHDSLQLCLLQGENSLELLLQPNATPHVLEQLAA